MPGGRPTTYTWEMAQRICAAMATSEDGLRKTLAKGPGLPDLGTVEDWLRTHVEFSSAYAQAKDTQIKNMAEDIIDLSNDDTLDPNDKRIRIDTRKWLLSKLIPRTYGDKIDVTSAGAALAAPSHQIDARIQSIIMQAQQRKAARLSHDTELSADILKLLT